MNSSILTSRRAFLKSIATGTLIAPFVTQELIAHPPLNRLRHASIGTAGMAWSDISQLTKHPNVDLVAIADVDLSKTGNARKTFPNVRVYQDWRLLLEKERRNIDSINVSTPDHMHARVAMAAMEMGKNVYVQKPMAHNLHEVRSLTSFARRKGLVTQMGIQIHSNTHYRLAVFLLQNGVIGKISEVHSWVPKSWGDISPLPQRQDTVPDALDWNGWLGVAKERPYIGQGYYHPGNWRKRLDFGTGTLGDMGCHILDPVFNGLQLEAPLTVRSEGSAPNEWNWSVDSRIRYRFRGTKFTSNKLLQLTWYDGKQSPPDEVKALLEGDPLPGAGSIFVGTEGTMVLPHINRPLLYPDAKYVDFSFPDIPGENHYFKFVDSCLGLAKTTAGFDYSGPLTEVVLLGALASRFPQTTLAWNSAGLSFSEQEPNRFVGRKYRSGWKTRRL